MDAELSVVRECLGEFRSALVKIQRSFPLLSLGSRKFGVAFTFVPVFKWSVPPSVT